ncbi:hypothetical protein [Pseudomonas sp. B21-053]|uniref:hypothetical protein n=1 Tax=Pseudomonas sp. B21-053 TaxID=2895493 RepID=UPI00223166DB|nr:hypothetical protein [Pseudomonas sp. B21-053]UZE12770.1 hypothetical protein LOY68_03935 [Pseudomonas sp. B21-053]
MGIADIHDAIERIEGLEAPKKVVQISLRQDFFERLTQSKVDNGCFGFSATSPDSVVPILLGVPYVIREQEVEFTLQLK